MQLLASITNRLPPNSRNGLLFIAIRQYLDKRLLNSFTPMSAGTEETWSHKFNFVENQNAHIVIRIVFAKLLIPNNVA